MPLIKVGRPVWPLKTTYCLLHHVRRWNRSYGLVQRTRTGQLNDLCFIVVVSLEPILPSGSIRSLAAMPSSGGSFCIKASNPKAWFGPDRLDDAKAAFTRAVRRGLKPKLTVRRGRS